MWSWLGTKYSVLRYSIEEKQERISDSSTANWNRFKDEERSRKKETTASSSNLFTQSEESFQTSEELFNITERQPEIDIDQELVKL